METEISDADLVLQYRDTKDSKFFSELYDRYVNKVYGRCLSFTHDADRAKDYAQDIFIRVLVNIHQLEEPKYFGSWLYTLTYRYCIDTIQKDKMMVSLDENNEVEALDDENWQLQEVRLEILQKGMQMMEEEERIMLLMKYKDEMTMEAIAELHEIGISAAKMRLKRSRDKLQDICLNLMKG